MEELATLEQLYQIGIGLTLSGFILGCFPMIIGLTVDGIIKIFKKA